jgi:hypothetical protein
MPTDLRGVPRGPLRSTAWPLELDGPAVVNVHFDRFCHPRPLAGGLIRLFDARGREIALARLKQ